MIRATWARRCWAARGTAPARTTVPPLARRTRAALAPPSERHRGEGRLRPLSRRPSYRPLLDGLAELVNWRASRHREPIDGRRSHREEPRHSRDGGDQTPGYVTEIPPQAPGRRAGIERGAGLKDRRVFDHRDGDDAQRQSNDEGHRMGNPGVDGHGERK